MTTKPNEPEAQKLRDLIAEIAADLSTENPFWTAKLLADALITRGIGIVPAHPVADAGGVTEDDVIGLINIVTDLAEVDALDKAYPEVWGRLDAMVNHAVAAATAARDAAIRARDDHFRNAQRLAEKLAAKDAEIAALKEYQEGGRQALLAAMKEGTRYKNALDRFIEDFENDFVLDGQIVDAPDPMLQTHYIIARAVLSEAREAGE
jgi:hypothetical protein